MLTWLRPMGNSAPPPLSFPRPMPSAVSFIADDTAVPPLADALQNPRMSMKLSRF